MANVAGVRLRLKQLVLLRTREDVIESAVTSSAQSATARWREPKGGAEGGEAAREQGPGR